jgi:coenzyme F420-reducing hydrogenase delta subunit/NAD-dependent dihydropyrimidine dehydrogenase PreA subunit
VQKHILIIGDEENGQRVADGLASGGFETRLLSPSSRSASQGLGPVQGSFDAYHVEVTGTEKPEPLVASRAILAPTPILEPTFSSLGLQPGEHVLSLSAFMDRMPTLPPSPDETRPGPSVAFFLGLAGETRPSVLRRVLEVLPFLRNELRRQVTILYGNLKVSGAGLEARVREARTQGVIFLRFSHVLPTFSQDGEGRVTVSCVDEASRLPMTFRPDLAVVDEDLRAGAETRRVAGLLHADPGPDGFLPSDNVLRMGCQTNRRGIVGLVPEADPLGRDTLDDDLDAVMIHMRALERLDDWEDSKVASIDPGRCARCLTCYRVCPHGAVTVEERVAIPPGACFGCGTCEAACPARAISLTQRNNAPQGTDPAPSLEGAVQPGAMVVFGCRRSADRARALCRHLGRELPSDLVFLPVDCAGRISRHMLLEPFLRDAAGVLVLACHPGNCHAEQGNLHARARVEEVQHMLEELGLEKERLGFHTLAANQGPAFDRIAKEFIGRIEGLKD